MKSKAAGILFLLVVLVMLLAACIPPSKVPMASSEMDMQAKSLTPPQGKALLYLYRSCRPAGRISFNMPILLDGHYVGQLAPGTYMVWVVDSGKHEILADISVGSYTANLSIDVKASQTYYIELKIVLNKYLLNVPNLQLVSNADGRRGVEERNLALHEGNDNKWQAGGVNANVSETIGLSPAVKSDIDDLPALKMEPIKNNYAIVIGIESYRQKLPKADYAASDAQAVTKYITRALGYPEENVVTLTNDHAALGDFVKYFEKWLPSNIGPGSTVFVYYSGHGAPDPKTGSAYLVPYDGDPAFIDETGYSLKRMYSALGKLPAKEIIIALDSCFSGAGGRSVIAKGSRPLVMNLQNSTVLSKNMTVMSASSGEQVSSTYDEKGHGLFTYFMLKGIKNEEVVKPDGSIKMDDLFGYIKPQVERIARKQYNNEQTPQLIGAKMD